MEPRNIFVLGWDEFNFAHNLDTLRDSPEYEFHELLHHEELLPGPDYEMETVMDRARARLNGFDGTISAIVSYWDFPACLVAPVLCRELGLPTAPPESVLACEHKYWSRVEQQKCMRRSFPRFRSIDPYTEVKLDELDLPRPFWIKPVLASMGQLGFLIRDASDLDEALRTIREKIPRIGNPARYLLDQIDMPDEIAAVGGFHCVAEGIVGGHQCTAEGYALDGEIQVYGIVDSFCYPGTSTFSRLQYPSTLKEPVKRRVAELSRRILTQVGFDHGAFNIEYYWDEETDDIWLLEINTRISQSHSNLFKKVDGVSHHKVMIDLALGRRPQMPQGGGEYEIAAKFMHKIFEDGYVVRVPDQEEIAYLQDEVPGAVVKLQVESGTYLSDHFRRDSYSYPLADLWIGADNEHDLLERYDRCIALLPFEIDHDNTPTASGRPTPEGE